MGKKKTKPAPRPTGPKKPKGYRYLIDPLAAAADRRALDIAGAILGLVLIVMLGQVACTAAQRVDTKAAVIDCSGSAVQAAKDRASKVVADVLGSDWDWEAIKSTLLGYATSIGTEALACAVQHAKDYLPPDAPAARALLDSPVRSRAGRLIQEEGWSFAYPASSLPIQPDATASASPIVPGKAAPR